MAAEDHPYDVETNAAEEVELSAREERSHMWVSTPQAQTPNSRSRLAGSLLPPDEQTKVDDAAGEVGHSLGASTFDLNSLPEPSMEERGRTSLARRAVPDTARELTASSASDSDIESLTQTMSFEGPSAARSLQLKVERVGSTGEAAKDAAMLAPFGEAQVTAAGGAKVTESMHSSGAIEDGMGR